MSTNPSDMVVLAGQALIFSGDETNTREYSFRLGSGETGVIPFSMLAFLGLTVNDLPAIVSSDLLVSGLDRTFARVSDLIIALSKKADLDRVLSLNAIKANKTQVAELISKVAYMDELQLRLNTKVDKDGLAQVFATKANVSEVYSIEQIHQVLMDFIGAAV